MRFPLHVVALLLLVASLLINLAFWGGVSTSKVLGPIVPDAVRLQAPLAYTWLVIGDAAARALGVEEPLARFAESQFHDPSRVVESRPLAGVRVLDERSDWLKLVHPLPLILLPIALLLWWRRPRGLKTFGGR